MNQSSIRVVHDSRAVYELLKDRNCHNYIYQLSDLMPEAWQKVVCYGLYRGRELRETAMVLFGYGIPVLLAANFENVEESTLLVQELKDFLPPQFYAHIDGAVLETVFPEEQIVSREDFLNMGFLGDVAALKEDAGVERLMYEDIEEIRGLLAVSYPGAWLDEDLVRLGKNFGCRVDGQLVSFAGIHAYSREYRVAAAAHVTTHPDFRQQGYCRRVLGSLLRDLAPEVGRIGLNVKADNQAAIECYRRLGFAESGRFVACTVRR